MPLASFNKRAKNKTDGLDNRCKDCTRALARRLHAIHHPPKEPDPEGFIIASRLTNSDPINCVVFEDSEAGIIAGNKIKMTTIGIGNSEKLNIANKVYKNFKEIKFKDFQIC